MRKINKKLLGLYIALASFLPFQAFAQSSGIQWRNGDVLTANALQSLDDAKMNLSSLGLPGFAAKLDALGRVTAPVVGDVSQAVATPAGQTVTEVATKANNAVQKTDANLANGYAKLDGSGNVTVPVTGSVAAAPANAAGDTVSSIADIAKAAQTTANAAIPKSNIGVKNGVAPLDSNAMMSAPVSGDSSLSSVTAANSIAVGKKARTQSERAMSTPQPADFLSSSQNVSDLLSGKLDVAPLINAAFSAGVKTIFLPCGTYSVQSQIAFTSAYQAIRGSGACTNLSIDSAGIIAILNQGMSDISISDLGITSSVARTAPDIKAYNSFRMMISHVIWHEGNGSAYTPLLLDGANDTHITDSEMHSTSETGFGVQITGTTQRTEDTYISNTNIYGFQIGLELNWSSGLYVSGMDILNNSSYGVAFNPSATQEIDGTRMSRVLSDTNNSNGFEFGGSGNITETTLTNCWASSNGHYNGSTAVNATGISIDNANTNNLSIIASEFHANTANGVAVEAGTNIIVSGNAFFMNGTNGITSSTATGNAYSGLLIDTNASHVVANGNMGGLGGVENAGTTNHQEYLINNQSANYVTMVGNMGNSHWGGASVYTATTTNVVNENNNGD